MVDEQQQMENEIEGERQEAQVALIAAYRNVIALEIRIAMAEQWRAHRPGFVRKSEELADAALISESRALAAARGGGLNLRQALRDARNIRDAARRITRRLP